jgi:hypothetical protein
MLSKALLNGVHQMRSCGRLQMPMVVVAARFGGNAVAMRDGGVSDLARNLELRALCELEFGGAHN